MSTENPTSMADIVCMTTHKGRILATKLLEYMSTETEWEYFDLVRTCSLIARHAKRNHTYAVASCGELSPDEERRWTNLEKRIEQLVALLPTWHETAQAYVNSEPRGVSSIILKAQDGTVPYDGWAAERGLII